MRSIANLAGAALLLPVASCATLTRGTYQHVSVRTPGATAQCTLSNDYGSWSGTTPWTANVHRSGVALVADCLAGNLAARASVPAEFNGMTVGNVLAGGVIGIGIDATNGSNYSYPKEITLPLQPARALLP